MLRSRQLTSSVLFGVCAVCVSTNHETVLAQTGALPLLDMTVGPVTLAATSASNNYLNNSVQLPLIGTSGQGPAAFAFGGNKYFTNDSPANYGTQIPISYYPNYSIQNVMKGDSKVYIIYYSQASASFPSSNQQSIIEGFINGVGSTNYWNIVRQYYYLSASVGTAYAGAPSVAKSIKVSCCGTAPSGFKSSPVSCNLGMTSSTVTNVETIITTFISSNDLPLEFGSLYLVVAAAGVTNTLGNSLGNSYTNGIDYCSYHSYFLSRVSGFYVKYAFIPVPTLGLGTRCYNMNVNVSPNGDPKVDTVIQYLNHELIELIVNPIPVFGKSWIDNNWEEVGDMCASFFGNVVYTSVSPGGVYASNIKVGGKSYLVNAVFDRTKQSCAMSNPASTSSIPQLVIPAVGRPCPSGMAYGRACFSGTTCYVCQYNTASQLVIGLSAACIETC